MSPPRLCPTHQPAASPHFASLPAFPTLHAASKCALQSRPHTSRRHTQSPKLSAPFPLETDTHTFQSRRPRTHPVSCSAIKIISAISFRSCTMLQHIYNALYESTQNLPSDAQTICPSRVSVRLAIVNIHLDIIVVYLIRRQQGVDPILRVQKCREGLGTSKPCVSHR
jgi:hypothetical protein